MIWTVVIAVLAGFVLYNLGTYMGMKCNVPKDEETTFLRLCRENAPLISGLAYVSMFLAVVMGTYGATSGRR